MSISELLPAIHRLPDPDKIQLIRVLAEDLAKSPSCSAAVAGNEAPVWTPHNAFEAADTLLAALRAEERQPTDA